MGQSATEHAPIRVVLVDNHASYRAGLRTLLELERDLAVVGEADTGDTALAVLEGLGVAPDVVVLDVDMPGMGGIEATRALLKQWSGLPILLLTAYAHYAEAGIHAGARGYVLKEQDGDDIIQAIRTLHRGGTALHPTAQVQLV
ncbi:MAG TPA: response regulator transcription factor, partial [Roseiflexaceae bacterium]|nr:response regulator transcription factor [Roseiflexaceae bacterium]